MKLARSSRWDGVVALGAVVQGETTHHEHLGREVSAALMRTMEETGVPVALGLLTTDSMEKALARAGGAVGNKGEECVLHLLETLDVLERSGIQK
jgi:6,7-dimethyl-8-ribityllumazine synthase